MRQSFCCIEFSVYTLISLDEEDEHEDMTKDPFKLVPHPNDAKSTLFSSREMQCSVRLVKAMNIKFYRD